MKVREHSEPFYSASRNLGKARNAGLQSAEDLMRLAVVRGLRYYDSLNQRDEWTEDPRYDISTDQFSNAELAIALLSPDLPAASGSAVQVRQRIASAVLSAEDVDPTELTKLAKQESCEAILRWIAHCGAEVEPDNPFWSQLLEALPVVEKPERAPHPTRFFAMSGIVNGRRQTVKQWIRLANPEPNG